MSGSGGDAGATSFGTVSVKPDPGFPLVFEGMHATEELGRPFEIKLDVSSTKAHGDLHTVLGSSVTVSLQLTDGTTRYFNGILCRAVFAGLSGGAYRYHLELRPWVWLLSRTQDCVIFQNQSAWTIVTSIFRNAGFTDIEDRRQNQAGETELEYCVQYRETSLDFVTRLMEEFGFYYYFEHTDGKHTMVMADDPNSHTALPDAIPYMRQMTEIRTVKDHIWEWSADHQLQPGAFTHRDYNFTTPSADLTTKSIKGGEHPFGSYEVYEYPGTYDSSANGQKLADIRMQALAALMRVHGGQSNARTLRHGAKITMSGASDKTQNREYLVVGTISTLGMGESKSRASDGKSGGKGELTDTYRCSFHAIPGDTPFRLDRKTRRPMIRGPQTARVVGQPGQEITTDQYGRIKVKFPWDRSAAQDETCSCWIRVSQAWAGASWGAMVIPRIGQEVIVEFLEGNPDRPIVTGSVYNANVTIPYGMPDNMTRTTLRSNSSPGGGGANELRFEDKKGDEEVFFQAQKDYNKVVLNNETVTITQDHATTVSQGNHSTTVSQGNHSTTVSAGNHGLTVSQGNHTITVSAGGSTITAAQSITLQVGANSITIDTSGVTINAAQVTVQAQATMTLQAGASMTIAGAMVAIN